MTPNLIYHITSGLKWSQARTDGEYRGDTLDTEGFIHTSSARQVIEVANRIQAGSASRGVAHASSGPCLQQNLVCVMDGGV